MGPYVGSPRSPLSKTWFLSGGTIRLVSSLVWVVLGVGLVSEGLPDLMLPELRVRKDPQSQKPEKSSNLEFSGRCVGLLSSRFIVTRNVPCLSLLVKGICYGLFVFLHSTK